MELQRTGGGIPAEPVGHAEARGAAGPQGVVQPVAVNAVDIAEDGVEVELQAGLGLQEPALLGWAQTLWGLVHVVNGEQEGGHRRGAIEVFGAETDPVGAHSLVIRHSADAAACGIELKPRRRLHRKRQAIADGAIVVAEQLRQIETDALPFADGAVLKGATQHIRRTVEGVVDHLELQIHPAAQTGGIGCDQAKADGIAEGERSHPAQVAVAGIELQPAGQIAMAFKIQAVSEAIAGILIGEQIAGQRDGEGSVLAQQDQRQLLATPAGCIVDTLDREQKGLLGSGTAAIARLHLQLPWPHLRLIGETTQQPAISVEPEPIRLHTNQVIGELIANGQIVVAEPGAEIKLQRLILKGGERRGLQGHRRIIDVLDVEGELLLPAAPIRRQALHQKALLTHYRLAGDAPDHRHRRWIGAQGQHLRRIEGEVLAGGQLGWGELQIKA